MLDGVMVIVQNLEDEAVRTVVSIPQELLAGHRPEAFEEQYSGDEAVPYTSGAGLALAVAPEANEVLVYRA